MKVLALVLLLAPWLDAQKIVSARAGMVYYAEGAFTIDGQTSRSGRPDRKLQLEEGQVAASPRGHAELLLGPDAALWTGTLASVRFDRTSIEDVAVTLLNGSAIVELRRNLTDSSITIQHGSESTVLQRAGVYRFDSGPTPVQRDEFHFWAAHRSFLLETESGSYRQWKESGFGERKHAGFGVEFPTASGAARMKYLAAGEAGLLYSVAGSTSVANLARPRVLPLPLRLGRENYVRTQNGSAEVFLGVGIVARIGAYSQLRMLDTSSESPLAALDEGVALLEVAESMEGIRPRMRVGDSVTEIQKPGLYRFDVKAGTLSIYAGQAATVLSDTVLRTRDAETLNLKEAAPAAKLGPAPKDALFQWSADRSFKLAMSSGGFMTDWQERIRTDRFKHRIYGERVSTRPRPLPRRL